jgi:hypothetical protein
MIIFQQIRNELEVREATVAAGLYDFQIWDFQIKGNFVYKGIDMLRKLHSNSLNILRKQVRILFTNSVQQTS